MGCGRALPRRLRRGFSDEAASAFCELVASRVAAGMDIEASIEFWRSHLGKVTYSIDWSTTEKFGWLFAIALKDADANRRQYWLEYVREHVRPTLDEAEAHVA